MKVMEALREQRGKWTEQVGSLWREMVDTPLIGKGITCLIWGLLALGLAHGEIMENCTPFGIGLVGAAGAGPVGLAALVGCCLGSVSALGVSAGLRCCGAAVLIFAAAFAAWDLKVSRRSWFMPLVTGVMNGITGLVYLAEGSWTPRLWMVFGLEIGLAAASCWFFRRALASTQGMVLRPEDDFLRWIRDPPMLEPMQKGCLLLLASLLTAALSTITVGGLSVGRMAALAAVMTVGCCRGGEAGVGLGVLFGFPADLMSQSGPYCTGLFALVGLTAALFGRRRRGLAVLAGEGAAVLIAVVWQRSSPVFPMEVLAAGVVFLLLPPRLFRRWKSRPMAKPLSPAVPAVSMLREQLDRQAEALRSLNGHLKEALEGSRESQEEDMLLFTRAAERVCQSCVLRSRCWQQDYSATRQSLHKALPRLLERGQAAPSDFDSAFREKCVHFPAFLSACSVEASNLLAHRRYRARVWKNRAAVCRQYESMGKLLTAASRSLGEIPRPDSGKSRRLEEHLRSLGVTARGMVARDRRDRLYVELLGDDLSQFEGEEFSLLAERIAGVKLRRGNLTCDEVGQRLTFVQQEPYTVNAGVATLPRKGDQVSGDTCCWFKGEDGILRVILCDGMGSGSSAAKESRLMASLLEELLRAGMAPEEALTTLNEAMALRCDLGAGFSTVDLLTIDLFSREGVLYKLGAAPSYLCRKGSVHRAAGGALPLGMGEPGCIRRTTMALEAGDLIVLVSDGITDGEEDGWLQDCLRSGRDLSAKGTAMAVLHLSERHGGGRDDRTVAAIRLSRRC